MIMKRLMMIAPLFAPQIQEICCSHQTDSRPKRRYSFGVDTNPYMNDSMDIDILTL